METLLPVSETQPTEKQIKNITSKIDKGEIKQTGWFAKFDYHNVYNYVIGEPCKPGFGGYPPKYIIDGKLFTFIDGILLQIDSDEE